MKRYKNRAKENHVSRQATLIQNSGVDGYDHMRKCGYYIQKEYGEYHSFKAIRITKRLQCRQSAHIIEQRQRTVKFQRP